MVAGKKHVAFVARLNRLRKKSLLRMESGRTCGIFFPVLYLG
jgi:hypothetical protein